MVLIYLKSHVPKIIKSPSIESRDLLTEDAEHNPLNSTVDGNEEKEETAVGELADLPATTESLSESDTINTVEEEEDLDLELATEKVKPEVSTSFVFILATYFEFDVFQKPCLSMSSMLFVDVGFDE